MKKVWKILGIIFGLIVLVVALLPVYFNTETGILDPYTRAQVSGDFIELPMGVTHYQEAGPDTGQTVLLVHGFSVPYYIWDPTFEALKNSGFHVIRFDLFGRGYSDRPQTEYNQALFTAQIKDLLSALEIQEAIHIIGLSMGGPITTEFTVSYPEKVDKVVLIDPVHESVDISVLKWPVMGEYLMSVYFAPYMIKSQLDDFYHPEAFGDWPPKFMAQMKFKGFNRAILSTLRNYMNTDKLPAYTSLGKLDKPVLLLWGTEDEKVPFDGNARIRSVLECEFWGIEETGHIPHYENPDPVNQRIIQFLHD